MWLAPAGALPLAEPLVPAMLLTALLGAALALPALLPAPASALVDDELEELDVLPLAAGVEDPQPDSAAVSTRDAAAKMTPAERFRDRFTFTLL